MSNIPCKGCAEKHLDPDPDLDPDNVCFYCNGTGEVPDPKEQICNNCGDCLCPEKGINWNVPYGLHNAKVQGSYESTHLVDYHIYTFSLCEKCLRTMFNEFKIKPKVMTHNIRREYDDVPFEQDQTQYEYGLYLENGGHQADYLSGKCNQVKNCGKKAVYTICQGARKRLTNDSSCEEHKKDWQDVVMFVPEHFRILC